MINARYFAGRPLIRLIAVHLLCWALFISYELSALYYSSGKLGHPVNYLIYYVLNAGLFYSVLWLLKKTIDRNPPQYLRAVVGCLLLVCLALLLKFMIIYYLQSEASTQVSFAQTLHDALAANIFRCTYFLMFAAFYRAAGYISVYQKNAAIARQAQLELETRNALTEKRLAITQNAYLQQQINPHLLFNSLNFIYSSIYNTSPEAANCVLLLSDLFRFTLEETDEDGKIALASEIEQIGHLIAINRFRFDYPLALDIQIAGDFEKARIIPLILLTLAENLFKHGDLRDMDKKAVLRLHYSDQGELSFYSSNLKKAKPILAKKRKIGMENLKIRLDFSYAGRYRLDIADEADIYELNLTIRL
jgi:two-component system LytT family sensor kinase